MNQMDRSLPPKWNRNTLVILPLDPDKKNTNWRNHAKDVFNWAIRVTTYIQIAHLW
jgi:hypothetical protein